MQCPREHLICNELGWLPETRGDALDHGLVWHYALEAYYRALQNYQQAGTGTLVDCEKAAFELLECFSSEPGYEEIYDISSLMLNQYLQRFSRSDAEEWEVVGVEVGLVPASVVLECFGFEYSTRLDLLIIDRSIDDEILRIVEHKSAARLDPTTISGYTHDLQTLGQIWLAENFLDFEHYPPFLGSLVNVTTKSKKQPLCERLPVQPSVDQLACFEDTMRYWNHVLEFYRGTRYRKNYGLCTRRYGRCPNFDLCRSMPDATADDLVRMHKEDDIPPGFIVRGA